MRTKIGKTSTDLSLVIFFRNEELEKKLEQLYDLDITQDNKLKKNIKNKNL